MGKKKKSHRSRTRHFWRQEHHQELVIGSFDLSPFNTKDTIYNDNYNYSMRTNSDDSDTDEQYH